MLQFMGSQRVRHDLVTEQQQKEMNNLYTENYKTLFKEINPKYSLEGLVLKLKLQYFGHLMQRADSLEKTLMLGKIEGKRRSRWQRMRRLDRMDQWT